MDLCKPKLAKFILLVIIAINLYLGLGGGFVTRHYDNEYAKTKANKTYCLHGIYRSLAYCDYQFRRQFSTKPLEVSLDDYMRTHQSSSFALLTVAIIFSSLGLIASFLLAQVLTNNACIGLLAAFFLGTSFFWTQEMHYPTVDLPCASLSIFSFYLMVQFFVSHSRIDFARVLMLGLFLGLAISMKLFALVLILPMFYLLRNFKSSLQVTLLALLVFAVCLYPKLDAFSTRVPEEIATMFQTGFWGYDNPSGHTFWYHLETSLYQEYGLALMLLSVLGILLAKRYIHEQALVKALFMFIVLGYFVVGITMCNATRYILPLLPLFAILSAIGFVAIYQYLARSNRAVAIIASALLLILSVFGSFRLVHKHNALMRLPSSRDQVGLELVPMLKQHASAVYDMPLHDLIPSLPRNISISEETALSCNSSVPLDIRAQYFKEPNSIVIFSSNNHDSFIYSWHCQCKDPQRKAFSNFEDLLMITINPFVTTKDQVPFSPDSTLSPNPPDIFYRKQPGFYYEIFVEQPVMANLIKNLCSQLGITCTQGSGTDSYYLNRIQGVDYSTLGKRP